MKRSRIIIVVVVLYSWFVVTQGQVSVFPAVNAIGVIRDVSIQVVCDTSLVADSISSDHIQVYGTISGYHECGFEYNTNTNHLIITPHENFHYGESIWVTLQKELNPDVLPNGYSFRFIIESPQSSGTFSSYCEIINYGSPNVINVGDFINDGFCDFAISDDSNNRLSICANNGDGTFLDTTWFDCPNSITDFCIADVDRDSSLDIVQVVSTLAQQIVFWEETDETSFIAYYSQQTGYLPKGIASGDLNNDGYVDFVTANRGDTTVSVFLYEREGSGDDGFQYGTLSLEAQAGPYAIAIEDVNNDGLLDIIVTNREANTITVINNLGDGNFGSGVFYPVGDQPMDLAVIDLNGDGYVDIITANRSDNTISVLLNDQSGSFSTFGTVATGNQPAAIYANELDADADIDLAIVNSSDENVIIYENSGDGTLTAADTISVGIAPCDIQGFDMYNRGAIDLAVVNKTSGSVQILKNIMPGGMTLSLSSVSGTEISGDGKIVYELDDSNKRNIVLLIDYSVDNGATWQISTVMDLLSSITPPNYDGYFIWNTAADLPARDIAGVMLRATPIAESDTGQSCIISIRVDNNTIPVIEIQSTTGEQKGDIPIEYSITDNESDVIAVNWQYSVNGFTWNSASVATTTFDSTQYTGIVIWCSRDDLPTTSEQTVYFRGTPSDNDASRPDTVQILLDNIGIPSVALNYNLAGELSGDISVDYIISDEEADTISLICEYYTSTRDWQTATVREAINNLDRSLYCGQIIWKAAVDLNGFDGNAKLRVTPQQSNQNGVAVVTSSFHVDNNTIPSIVVSTEQDTISRYLEINYNVTDAENDDVGLLIKYSKDRGITWQNATTTESFTAIPSNIDSVVIWDTFNDLGFAKYDSISIMIFPFDNDTGTAQILSNFTIRNFPAEFTGDCIVNSSDLAIFAAAWNTSPQNILYDIGPATGVVPNLQPVPDGVLDFEDLMVFVQMWNWSYQNDGQLLRKIPVNGQFVSYITNNVNSDGSGNWSQDLTFYINNCDDLMMMEGCISGNSDVEINSITAGKYLGQNYQSTPILQKCDTENNTYSFWIVGLGKCGNEIATNLPIITANVSQAQSGEQSIIMEYRLWNTGGEICATGSLPITVASQVPTTFRISDNYPNPFNPSTRFRYEIPTTCRVNLEIFDLTGKVVKDLLDESVQPGFYEVDWDSKTSQGTTLPTGVYFYRFTAGKYSRTGKMLLIK